MRGSEVGINAGIKRASPFPAISSSKSSTTNCAAVRSSGWPEFSRGRQSSSPGRAGTKSRSGIRMAIPNHSTDRVSVDGKAAEQRVRHAWTERGWRVMGAGL